MSLMEWSPETLNAASYYRMKLLQRQGYNNFSFIRQIEQNEKGCHGKRSATVLQLPVSYTHLTLPTNREV